MKDRESHQLLESLEEQARERGRAIEHELVQLKSFGFDVSLLERDTAICLNVAAGPELLAMKSLGVARLFATEPSQAQLPDGEMLFENEHIVLEKIVQETGASLVRDLGHSSLARLSDRRVRANLITSILMAPNSVNQEVLTSILESAAEVLKAGGSLFLSAEGPETRVLIDFGTSNQPDNFSVTTVTKEDGLSVSGEAALIYTRIS